MIYGRFENPELGLYTRFVGTKHYDLWVKMYCGYLGGAVTAVKLLSLKEFFQAIEALQATGYTKKYLKGVKKMNKREMECVDCAARGDWLFYGGSYYCDDCFKEKYETCYRCSNVVPRDEMHEVQGEVYCDDCYLSKITCCDGCGDEIPSDETHYVRGEGQVCENCWGNSAYCNNCDEYIRADDYAGDGLCESCARENRDMINSYSANVLHYLDPDKGLRLYGVELEVACRSDYDRLANEVNDLVCDDAILKYDSSIDDAPGYEGFEIVTRPMTFENQIKFWNRFLDYKPDGLHSYDPGSCGLHVHVTKKSITPLTRGKIIVFLNEPKHEMLIRKIAKRYDCGFSKSKKDAKFTDGNKSNASRYEFFNLQNNDTGEFRLFRGTLNRIRLIACIEFCRVCIEFCEQTGMADLTESNFLAFLEREPGLKNLKTILNVGGKKLCA